MHKKENYEPKISLRDLIFHTLYHWRSIMIAAMLMAVAVAGYQYLQTHGEKNTAAWRQKKEAYQQELELYNRERDTLNEGIQASVAQIEALRAYQAHSLLYQIDPEAEWYTALQYSARISSETTETMERERLEKELAACYIGAIRNADAAQLVTLTGADGEAYARELITVRTGIPDAYSGFGDRYAEGNLISRGELEEGSIFTVEIRGNTEETVRKLKNYLAGLVTDEKAEVSRRIAKHELILLNDALLLRTDPELKAEQESEEAKIRTMLTAIQNNQKGLTSLTAPSKPSRASLLRYAVIGAVLGAILMIGIYVFSYVLGGKLHLSDELRRRYGLPIYADFIHSRARRPGKGIDGILEKAEFRHSQRDTGAVLDNMCALLRKNGEEKDLLLTGTASPDKTTWICGELKARVPGINVTALADYLHSAEAVACSAKVDCVLLVEEKHHSRLTDMDREAELLSINQAKVSGFIVV